MSDENREIKAVIELPRDKWTEFVYNHPHGNIFQTPEMFEVYKNTKNYEPFFIAVENNEKEILAILLTLIQKEYSSFLGKFTSRSIIFGSPLLKKYDLEVLNLLLYEYNNLIRKKVIYSQFRNFWEQKWEKPIFEKYGFIYDQHLNIIIDLTVGKDKLWKNLSNSRQKGIRKAIKNNFDFEISDSKDLISYFYKLLENTYMNAKLPYPKIDFFYSLHKELTPDKLKFFTLSKDNEKLIILIALIFKNRVYGFFMGTTRDNEHLKMRPVDLLFWEVLNWAYESGFTKFDWLGAGRPDQEYGVRKFKLQYGGEVVEWGRYEKIHKPFMMNMGKTGLKIWQKFK